jgi:NDP-sugar pyrophosphorylase family protein
MNSPAGDIDVLLLAAGFGTRLRPLTHEIPKALLPIYGVPLLDYHIERLLAPPLAARRVVVNGHHLAEQLRTHLARHGRCDQLLFSHEPEIMGTGGAIHWARALLDSDPFAVVNSDALFAAPFPAAAELHRRGGHLITLILCGSPIRPNILAEEGRVTALLDAPDDRRAYTFSGCQLISREAVDLLPAGSFHDIRETYRALIEQGRLGAFIASSELPLLDVGSPASYLLAHRLCRGADAAAYGFPQFRPARDTHAPAEGYGYIDRRAQVARSARVRESVVLWGARIDEGVTVQASVVGPNARISETADRLLVTRQGTRALAI